MTWRYLILQTKLKELESILTDALLRGPEAHSHEDIKQKLAFIGNLLSAEVAASSSSSHHHHHLQHISERLATLEKAFHEWDSLRVRALFSCDNDIDDDDSTCSCNESCLNYDDENGELIVFDDPEKLFPDSVVGEKAIVEFKGSGVSDTIGRDNVGIGKLGSFVYEDAEDSFQDFANNKELVEFDGCLLGKKEEEEGRKENELGREERSDSVFFGRNCCCAVAGGVVIGMSLMGFIMVNLSGCFYFVEQASFAIPT